MFKYGFVFWKIDYNRLCVQTGKNTRYCGYTKCNVLTVNTLKLK